MLAKAAGDSDLELTPGDVRRFSQRIERIKTEENVEDVLQKIADQRDAIDGPTRQSSFNNVAGRLQELEIGDEIVQRRGSGSLKSFSVQREVTYTDPNGNVVTETADIDVLQLDTDEGVEVVLIDSKVSLGFSNEDQIRKYAALMEELRSDRALREDVLGTEEPISWIETKFIVRRDPKETIPVARNQIDKVGATNVEVVRLEEWEP